MPDIDVACMPAGPGWSCDVTVTEGESETRHAISVAGGDLARFAPPGATPDQLVRESFEFLLEREPKESILRDFELPVIGRYFPEFEREIRRRLEG